MFHQGDLQSGIAAAIQSSRSVVCFVQDENTESLEWEQHWLREKRVAALLAAHAVLLRIEAGSQEAGFLSAFCPIENTPTLVIIHNGQLRENILSGVTKEDFVQRVSSALHPAGVLPATQAPSSVEPATTPQSSMPAAGTADVIPTATSRPSQSPTTAGKRKAVDTELASSSSTNSQQLSYAAQQRLRERTQRDERNRILAQIEDDRRERKSRAEQAKAQRLALESGETDVGPTSQLVNPSSQQQRPTVSAASNIALQIRLLDGSNLRNRFDRTATLAKDVRPWIDTSLREAEGVKKAPPYTFKHVLSPQPNRALGEVEERETLESLGLAPSATLVLVPVRGAVEAYAGAGAGLAGGLWAKIQAILAALLAVVLGLFGMGGEARRGSVAGRDRSAAAATPSGQSRAETSAVNTGNKTPGGGVKIRTLRDQRDEDNQYYNGNSLDFEPKDKDEEKK
ncbi:hypothetical protein K490DRAFT_36189 [Saccharata proteae CBS 121410]|uniref:UBX domain-containing protein 2 n=1 Tax=Saccharata proteae CBS 121410 TaxID=1314787 RepID=A0A9P4HW94_9PEZI|nr:hypothetical protein K490DRAFT_36189 [Saccharata proteae CBS 121410]